MPEQTLEAPAAPTPAAARVAADVMNSGPRTCSKFSRVIEAVLIFKDEDCGIVPIVDAGKPIGVVTDRDVALGLARFDDLVSQPVESIMSTDLISVAPTTPLNDVVDKMRDSGVRRLLVVDAAGLLAGVIAWKDVSAQLPQCVVGQIVTNVVESPLTTPA